MIKQIRYKNYAPHVNAVLNLRPGVNMIVGESDCGKSWLLRGLRWLVFNRPTGFAFKSHPHLMVKGEDTSVAVTLSDGVTVERCRNAKDNLYRVSTVTEDLEAVRTDVPDEVKAALRMDTLNVQRQGDKPYLLDDPPAEVARVLNMVAGLDSIDAAHTRVAGKIRENQGAQRLTDAQLLSTKTKLEAYAGLPELQARVDVFVRAQGRLKGQVEKAAELNALVSNGTDASERLTKTKGLPSLSVKLERLQGEAAELLTATAKAERLRGCVGSLETVQFRLGALPAGNLKKIETELLKAEKAVTVRTEKETRLSVLFELGRQARGYTDAVAATDAEITKVETVLKAYNTCPQCGAERKHWKV